MSNDERFDALLLGVAQQHEGIDALLDTLLGFLRRKTDFFTGPGAGSARDTLLRAYERHAHLAHAQSSGAPAATAAAAAPPRPATRSAAAAPETPAAVLAREAAELGKRTAPRDVEVVDGDGDGDGDGNGDGDGESGDAAAGADAAAAAAVDGGDAGAGAAKKSKVDKGSEPNVGNGGTGPGYVWTQVLAEVEVRVPLEFGTRGKALDVRITKRSLRIAYKNRPDEPLVDGALSKEVRVDDSLWTIEDKKLLVLTLVKQNQMEWWDCVIDGHPRINTQKVQPENSKLSDLDDETRATVEKMMFDQRAKETGGKTSEQIEKEAMLKSFMDQHPEMDFSQAKIN